ncbi:MAG: hypothetical protein KDA91_05945 [Planctomycetaceae bacterium]|nr:hypothetical protein [Planctomycetaceae bacterium]
MTTAVDETVEADDQTISDSATTNTLPDASVLEDKTPEWFRTPGVSVLCTMALGLIFLQMAFQPLWHTDLWDHINYGQRILETGHVSSTEPLLKLAEGMPMVNFPWLVQLAMAAMYNGFGLSSLQFASALIVASMMAIVCWRTTRKSGSVLAGLLAIAIFATINHYQFTVIRPQIVGLLFFTITVSWSMARQRHTRFTWICMPLMFAVWANCHGSFSVGLTLMALTGAGRLLDIWVRSRSLRLAILDSQFDKTVMLTQLCGAAVLLNPAGLSIYQEVLQISANPNIESIGEWFPMSIRTIQGQVAAGMTLWLLGAMHLSPRRIRFVELLPLVTMGLLACWSLRMINWWAPLMAVSISTHTAAAVRLAFKRRRRTEPYPSRGLWTVVNIGLCWIFFSFTHFGVQVVHGRVADPARLVSRQTPVQLIEYLNSKESWPKGLAFVPAEWAGFVMNAGPESIQPMVNLHVHVIPEMVWNDYLRLIHGPNDWDSLMDQYGVNLAIIDKEAQPRLLKNLSQSEDWNASYQDNQAVVFVRNTPI